jgi:hypothetical protein
MAAAPLRGTLSAEAAGCALAEAAGLAMAAGGRGEDTGAESTGEYGGIEGVVECVGCQAKHDSLIR